MSRRAATGLDFGGAATSCIQGAVILGRYGSADGAHKWSKCLGSGVESVTSAVLDGSGNVVIAGTLADGTTDFGTGALSAQGKDMFVASFALSNGAAGIAGTVLVRIGKDREHRIADELQDLAAASRDRAIERLEYAIELSDHIFGRCAGRPRG